MKKIGIITLFVALIATAFTISNLWKVIDADKITVNFKLKNDGTVGTFTGVEATIDFDELNLEKSSLKTVVQVKSLSTNNEGRDEHLKNPDFFDAEKYPIISFESSNITKSATGFIAKGNLTMKGQTHEIEVPFTFEKDKAGNASFKGSMEVSPYQFGVIKNEKRKDEIVSVSVEIPLKK